MSLLLTWTLHVKVKDVKFKFRAYRVLHRGFHAAPEKDTRVTKHPADINNKTPECFSQTGLLSLVSPHRAKHLTLVSRPGGNPISGTPTWSGGGLDQLTWRSWGRRSWRWRTIAGWRSTCAASLPGSGRAGIHWDSWNHLFYHQEARIRRCRLFPFHMRWLSVLPHKGGKVQMWAEVQI